MNWGTLYQRILLTSGQPANQADRVKQALVDALSHHRHDRFYFSQTPFNFTLSASTAAYGEATAGFPKELVEVIGDHLFLDRGGLATDRHPLDRVSQEELALRQAADGGSTSQPEVWAFFNREIHLYPTPDSSTDIVRGRGFVDQWVPIVRYEAAVWKYYKPLTTSFIGGNELTDAYPTGGDLNPWLTEDAAAAMLRHYAEYLLWSQAWQANDGQDTKALNAYTVARHSVEARTQALLSVLQIEPYPIGPYAD